MRCPGCKQSWSKCKCMIVKRTVISPGFEPKK